LARGDLTSGTAIYLKGFAFLGIGLIATVLLLIENWNVKTALLLGIIIWSFCRFYYFAFYVIEHYVDGQFRFAGLIDFLRYLLGKRRI
jgi:hypothetical protein